MIYLYLFHGVGAIVGIVVGVNVGGWVGGNDGLRVGAKVGAPHVAPDEGNCNSTKSTYKSSETIVIKLWCRTYCGYY
jgi:hypothetical protein